MRIFWMLLSSALLLSGCASIMSEEECLVGDWYMAGYSDGVDNQTIEAFEKRVKACEKYDVTPNTEDYEEGYAKGFEAYCTPQGGFLAGEKGRSLKKADTCPAETRIGFLEGYDAGIQLYRLRQQVTQAQNEVQAFDNQLRNNPAQIERKRREIAKIRQKDISQKEKDKRIRRLLNDIDRLRNELDYAYSNLRRAEENLSYAINRLNDYANYLDRYPPY